uniref:Ovule protein n=1 Tax=Panagrellus redivivus TaxID=6233 RepID=A0A7E4ZT66_PANRE
MKVQRDCKLESVEYSSCVLASSIEHSSLTTFAAQQHAVTHNRYDLCRVPCLLKFSSKIFAKQRKTPVVSIEQSKLCTQGGLNASEMSDHRINPVENRTPTTWSRLAVGWFARKCKGHVHYPQWHLKCHHLKECEHVIICLM